MYALTEIMELHHKKHHQAYVTNYNAALGKLADAEVRGRRVLPSGRTDALEVPL
jgi:superoxide dismutase